MEQFVQLGNLIERRWRDRDYGDDVFPSLAAEALRESDLVGQVDPWEIIQWVHRTHALPQQQDPAGKFGNPPITVFSGSRFYVDVYFWLDGTTAIHQHAFSGAFQVLLGGSVHSGYRFDRHCEINPHFLIGNVSLHDVSLLAIGDVREIRPGPQFIHSLFHLDRPSATITVRSSHSPAAGPQYEYLVPYLARDPFFHEASLAKKVQTVALLLNVRHPDADRFIGDLLDTADFHTTFCVLEAAFKCLDDPQLAQMFQWSAAAERFQALVARARRRHGDRADLLPAVFEEKRRRLDIARRRTMIADTNHRFFLALLLNVPERAALLNLIKQKCPDADPVELAVRWTGEMATKKMFGSLESNVLGLKNFEKNHRVVLEGLLRGLPRNEIERLAASRLAPGIVLQVHTIMKDIKASSVFTSVLATGSRSEPDWDHTLAAST